MQMILNRGGARRSAPLFILVLVALGGIASAGVVDSLWTRLYNGHAEHNGRLNQAADMVIDSARNRIYVCGSGEGDTTPGLPGAQTYQRHTNMLLVAYRLDGTFLWSREYGGNSPNNSEDDMAQAMAVDGAGNVWIAGTTTNYAPRNEDISWCKFDSLGNPALWSTAGGGARIAGWKSLYDGGSDYAWDVVIGKEGGVYICGAQDTVAGSFNGTAFTVIRVSPDSNTILWKKCFILDINADKERKPQRDVHPYFYDDEDWYTYENAAYAIAAAGDSGVVVAGQGYSSTQELDGWVMKLRPNGTQVWQTPIYLGGERDDVLMDVAVAKDGSVYTCGLFETVNSYDAGTYRLNGTTGAFINSSPHPTAGFDDWAVAITLDDSTSADQCAYVTCFHSDDERMMTRRYNHTLSQQWGASGALLEMTCPYDISFNKGRVYVSTRDISGANDDLKVVCYTQANPPSGTKEPLWTYTYGGPAGGEDLAANVVALDSNRVYVAGQSDESSLYGLVPSLYLSRLYYPYRDVQLQGLTGLPDTVEFGDSARAQAWVRNLGTGFAVGCTAQLRIALYRDTVVLDPIAPGESAQVTFDWWYANGLGSQAVRCTVAMLQDSVADNNHIDRTVFVIRHDVTCSLLVSPAGVVDSGASVTPQAWVKNLGNRPETFDTRLAVGGFYTSTRNATLNPDQSALLSFDATVLRNRGTWTVQCSTMLGTDRVPANDAQSGTVRIRVTDGATVAIISPPDTVNSGSDVPLSARFRNSGTDAVTLRAFFRAEYGTDKDAGLRAQTGAGNVEALMTNSGRGVTAVAGRQLTATSYPLPSVSGPSGKPPVGGLDTLASFDSLDIALAPLAESTVVFGTLYDVQRLGTWQITARCSLAADQVPANNTVTRTMFVLNRDVACSLLVAPTGVVDSGASVTPQAWVRNYGSQAETFNTRLSIGGFYSSTRTVTVGVGAAQLVSFDATALRARGAWAVRCTTMLANDRQPANDIQTGTVNIRVTDAAVSAITAPPDTLHYDDNATLAARFGNRGTDAATVRCWFRALYGGDTVAYFDSIDLAMAPVTESLVTFAILPNVQRMGLWSIAAWCALAGDQVPANNAINRTMFVLPPGGVAWPPGWREVDSVPRSGGKPVKAGGALGVMDQGLASTIYALKGNKTGEFYKYDMMRDSWTALPPVIQGPGGKMPYTGARLCGDNQRYIYALKGNNTFEFWRFDTDAQTWERKDDVPAGPRKQKIKGGDDLAYVHRNDSSHVYLLKGYRNEFYRFNVRRDTWEALDSAPIGQNAKYAKGSFLVNDGERYLYVVKAKYGELWRFDTDAGKWDHTAGLAPMPLYNGQGRRKKPADGAGGGWYNNGFYALKGGNTGEFWRYDAARDTWAEKETLNSVGHTGRKKLVKSGGALVNSRYAMWALKGNKTTEFWRYGIPLGLVYGDERPSRDGISASGRLTIDDCRLSIAPNPMSGSRVLHLTTGPLGHSTTISIYDALGRLVLTRLLDHSTTSHLDVRSLSAGVYLVHISAGDTGPVRTLKLVIR